MEVDAGYDAGYDASSDAGYDASPDAEPVCVSGTGDLPRPLELPNPDPNGIYDPNLAWDPGNQRLWMSYSGVDGPAGSGQVSTHLSFSDDRGVTWCHAGVVNPSTLVPRQDQPAAIAQDHAHWSHETSAIVYDPTAPEGEQWSLIWHQYLHVEDNDPLTTDDRHFEHGWIAQRRASSPWGLFSAPEEKLFSAVAYHFQPDIEEYNDNATGGLPIHRFDADADLGTCLAFAEPGIIAVSDRLYVAMFCYRTEDQQDIVLVEFDRDADQWSAKSTLLTTADAQAIHPALVGFNAADLYQVGDTHRLMVTPTTGTYLGCIEYQVDLTAGTLSDSNGDGPDPLYTYDKNPDPDVYQTGACTYHEQSDLGILVGDVFTSGVQFRLVATGDMR